MNVSCPGGPHVHPLCLHPGAGPGCIIQYNHMMLIYSQTPSLNVTSAQGRQNAKQDISSSSNHSQGMKYNLYLSAVVLQVALLYENANKATIFH